ncbi:hypothetical protein EV646_114159 [Kribbella antiqua]|uniref:Uncharacterized protein n=1 Tax=Kribbella antiqua TaxID=2512217 RepID=A0A4R2IHY8_9ACTN|nr:hypothetical protein EV646_114159 [Kribbella antiqua]
MTSEEAALDQRSTTVSLGTTRVEPAASGGWPAVDSSEALEEVASRSPRIQNGERNGFAKDSSRETLAGIGKR